MPRLIRTYIVNCLIGFAVAALFVAGLIWFDVANLRHLLLGTDKGWLAILILWVSNGIVFAGVQFAIVIMGKADDDDDDPRGGRRQRVAPEQMIPVRVTAGAQARNGRDPV